MLWVQWLEAPVTWRRCSVVAVLGVVLALVSVQALSAKWVLIGGAADRAFSIYVDATSKRESGKVVKMWHLFD